MLWIKKEEKLGISPERIECGRPEWADTGEGQREQKQLSAWSRFNNLHPEVGPESIEWFIEGQAFSRS
jgi:hypothetical protein